MIDITNNNKEDLIELYFEDKNIEQIEKLLPNFKIKKQIELKKNYIERLKVLKEEINLVEI